MANYEKKITNYLKRHDGISMLALSKGTKISYNTILKYIEILKAKKLIKVWDIGNNKLIYLNVKK